MQNGRYLKTFLRMRHGCGEGKCAANKALQTGNSLHKLVDVYMLNRCSFCLSRHVTEDANKPLTKMFVVATNNWRSKVTAVKPEGSNTEAFEQNAQCTHSHGNTQVSCLLFLMVTSSLYVRHIFEARILSSLFILQTCPTRELSSPQGANKGRCSNANKRSCKLRLDILIIWTITIY